MSGRHAFNKLTEDFSPERRARVDGSKADLRAAMPLHELRRARAMTQLEVGKTLHVNQPAVAKLERRTDMYVSNLRAYIEAMGGRLNIVAEFPQGAVTITNFSDLDGAVYSDQGS
jgi:DNA-binding XRE family transcriptional regulator